jgi:hypothetical protein
MQSLEVLRANNEREAARQIKARMAGKNAKPVHSYLPALHDNPNPQYASFSINAANNERFWRGPWFTVQRCTFTSMNYMLSMGVYDLIAELRKPKSMGADLGLEENPLSGLFMAHLAVLDGITKVSNDEDLRSWFVNAQDRILLATADTPDQAYRLVAGFHESAFHMIGSEMNFDYFVGVRHIDPMLNSMVDSMLILHGNRVSHYREFGEEQPE